MARVVGLMVLIAVAAPLIAQEQATPEQAPEWMVRYQEMVAARDAGDLEAWLAGSRATQLLRPDHPILMFHEARALVKLGRLAESRSAMERILALGTWVEPPVPEDFGAAFESPEWEGFDAVRTQARAPLGRSRVALEVVSEGIVPEGIARDPRTGALYLGSMTRRAILEVHADGTTSERITSGADGLLLPLGIEVDGERGEIWAVSVSPPELGQIEGAGRTAVHGWRLEDRKLVARVVFEPKEGELHQFNDLALAADGTVYVTDPSAGSVWRLRRTKTSAPQPAELELVGEAGSTPGANGITIDAARGVAWIGCYNFGLCRLDLSTERVEILAPPAGVTLLGIDGLELYQGSLLAVQNVFGLDRVVRITLDEGGRKIEKVDVLDARHPAQQDPTTGVIVPGQGGPDRFLWIANARIEPWYRSQGAEVPAGPTVVLAVDLERGSGE